jgi:type VI secretion system protein ImpJ
MASASRVAWREGLFLRPQHFQQQDRFIEALVNARAGVLSAYPWGLVEIRVNESLLQLRKFGVEHCVGVLPDGCPFAIPAASPPPDPIDIPADTRDAVVYLTLPALQPGAVEFGVAGAASAALRQLVEDSEVFDSYADTRQAESIELARPNLTFGLTPEHTEGRIVIALAKIREVAGDQVVLDERFIAAALDVLSSPRLKSMMTDILGRTDQRVDELALRAAEASRGGAESVAPFLMLQTLNRWQPVLAHLDSLPHVHAERLYEVLLAMTGELATLALPQRRPPRFPTYDHRDLQATFEPVFDLLQAILSQAIGNSAGILPLEVVGPGAYTARIEDHGIFKHSRLFLAVRASAPPEALTARFASVVKLGPVQRMRDIVSSALQAGVRISQTPTPPPQIRALPGYVYFELDRASPDWPELAKSPAIGLHVAGDWPDLELELWWVKRGQS